MYKIPCPPDSRLVPVKYSFLKPQMVRTISPSGLNVLMGYGIGDIIEVMEPNIQYLIVPREKLEKIELTDGTVILDEIEDGNLIRYTGS
jgi:hypothetical protein